MSNKDFLHFLQVVHDGLTGRISIKNGLRDSVNLAIIRLDTSGIYSKMHPKNCEWHFWGAWLSSPNCLCRSHWGKKIISF